MDHADIDHTGLTGAGGSVATDTIWDAKGDLAAGTAANTAAKLTVGANDTILMADSGQSTGLKWVASQTPSTQAFGDAAAEGTADTYARGDHKHAMPANSGYLGYIRVEDQKTANTAGGGFTSGSYQTRTLNTEVTDSNNDCTLASNQITLAAGTYEAFITAPAYYVGQHKARLRNTTDSSTVLVGTSEYATNSTSDIAQTQSTMRGRFTIAGSKALEVQHQCAATKTTNGFGVAANMTEVEIYTVAEFWRVS